MSHKNKEEDKRGVSTLVSYVFLIVIVVTLAILVYSWLKPVIPQDTAECPEKITLVISNITCDSDTDKVKIKIKNKGLFNVDGINLKISDDIEKSPSKDLVFDMEQGDMLNAEEPLSKGGFLYFKFGLQPGEEFTIEGDYSGQTSIKRILIQALKIIDGEGILCENAILKEEVENCD